MLLQLCGLIVTALSVSTSAQADCPPGLNLQLLGRCLLVELDKRVTWCEAQETCWQAGGELLMDLDIIRQGNGSIETIGVLFNLNSTGFWIGVSDLADERNSSMSGWQLSGTAAGELLPEGKIYWGGELSGADGGIEENCLNFRTAHAGLRDISCLRRRLYVCQLRPGSNQVQQTWSRIAMDPRVRPGSATQYCFALSSQADSLIECAAFAVSQQFPVKAIVYSRSARLCRALLFTDSLMTEGDIAGASDWVKLRPFY